MNVLDDFLPQKDFIELKKIVMSDFCPWFFTESCTLQKSKNDPDFYFSHIIYIKNQPCSDFFNIFNEKLIKKLNPFSLVRIKLNCYPRTSVLTNHLPHVDFDRPHKNFILSFNTCDGFTRMEDGTKIESIENRAIFFDGGIKHNSTTCTDQKARFNININYL
tara:strand:- start:241 stop:726 length:486 start_codon:yes stop_codon:yes gene_type:complete